MTATATFTKQITVPSAVWQIGLAAAAVAVLAALAVPLLRADAGPLTAYESLYVSEAVNIAEGHGFTYTTGEAVHHRGPLFPVLVAADFLIGGVSLEHASLVPKLFALGNAILLLVIGWRFFGREAGLMAAALALAASTLNVSGSSLGLDGTQTFFLLLALLLMHPALIDGKPALAGLAGASLGLAMLTKESAVLWLPLPFLAVLLLGPGVSRPGSLLAATSLGFAAVAGWWWPYVYIVTSDVYLLGDGWTAAFWLAAGALALILIAATSVVLARRNPPLNAGTTGRWAIAGALLLIWGALVISGLENNFAWGFPPQYLANVPDYTTDVLSSVRPLPLIGIAWAYVAYRSYRGSLGDRLALLALFLFVPFALFVANRSLDLRSLLPLIYLSYLVLGRTAVDFARWMADGMRETLGPTAGAMLAAGIVVAAFGWFAYQEGQRFADQQERFDAAAVHQANWYNPLAMETAAWIEEQIPPGTPFMSAQLYSTHLYTMTEAAYPIWQLPTVMVDVDQDGLTRASTLSRWEDHSMPSTTAEPWLYLRRHAVDGYYIALSERDLIASLSENAIEIVILTGDDDGFSSLSLLPYFDNHPYFTHAQSFIADDANQVHIFQVTGSFDKPTNQPTLVSGATLEALEAKLGHKEAAELLESLSPGGYATSSAYAEVWPPKDE